MNLPLRRAVSLAVIVFTGFTGVQILVAAGDALSGPGTAVVVTSEGSTSHRNSGGSATPFSFALPRGASCPGDSANGGYRVQSFIVPATIDPGTLVYKSTGPVGDNFYPLFDTYTRGFAQVQTANADAPGGPGQIVNISTFDYNVFPRGILPAGRYHIGIACSLSNKTVRFWSVDILLAQSSADRPAGLTWRVAVPPPDSQSSLAKRIAVGVVILVVAVGVVVLVRRRRLAVGGR